MCLPDNFFGNETPKLRRLSLNGWHFKSWETPLLAGLTSLKLSSGVAPSVSIFLDALERMPRLSELDLHDVLPEVDASLEPRLVPLAHIKSLNLNASLKKVTGFLTHVSLPASANLDITCSVKVSEDISAYSSLANALNHWLSNPIPKASKGSRPKQNLTSTRSIKSIKLSHNHVSDFDLSCYFKRIDWYSNYSMVRTPSPLHLRVVGDSKRSIKELIKGLALSDVRAVSLELPLTVTELDQLGRLPSIQCVRAYDDGIPKFVQYLNNDPAMRPAKTVRSHNRRKKLSYFRSLKSISLISPNFEREESMGVPCAIKRQELLDLITMRYELGGEIEKLSIRDATNLDNYDIKLIKETCLNVEWDGCVDIISEEDDYVGEDHFFDEYDYDSDYGGPDFFPLGFYDIF